MYFKIVLAALCFVSLALAGGDVPPPECPVCPDCPACPPDCGPNAEFRTCGGCDGTCDDRNPACDRSCHVGCFCCDGFVRDKDGNCISPDDCPHGCPNSKGN